MQWIYIVHSVYYVYLGTYMKHPFHRIKTHLNVETTSLKKHAISWIEVYITYYVHNTVYYFTKLKFTYWNDHLLILYRSSLGLKAFGDLPLHIFGNVLWT